MVIVRVRVRHIGASNSHIKGLARTTQFCFIFLFN